MKINIIYFHTNLSYFNIYLYIDLYTNILKFVLTINIQNTLQ